jgi:hypothetical protein
MVVYAGMLQIHRTLCATTIFYSPSCWSEFWARFPSLPKRNAKGTRLVFAAAPFRTETASNSVCSET